MTDTIHVAPPACAVSVTAPPVDKMSVMRSSQFLTTGLIWMLVGMIYFPFTNSKMAIIAPATINKPSIKLPTMVAARPSVTPPVCAASSGRNLSLTFFMSPTNPGTPRLASPQTARWTSANNFRSNAHCSLIVLSHLSFIIISVASQRRPEHQPQHHADDYRERVSGEVKRFHCQ